MNIVFFGSSAFAVPIFERLINSKHNVSLCVTQADKRKGRGMDLGTTPVKESALFNDIRLLQPLNVNNPKAIDKIINYKPDIFVVVAFGQIISQELLKKVKYPLGVHPSLLPKYRGASPVNNALLNGEEITGVTVFVMNERLDAGDIVKAREIKIRFNENALNLSKRLSIAGGNLLVNVLDDIEEENISLISQDEDRASYAPKLKKKSGLIDWEVSAVVIHNKIRGMFPWPGAFTYYDKKGSKELIKIKESECYSSGGKYDAGEILDITSKGIVVGTSDGSLLVKVVQPAGKQKMDAYSFVQGARLGIEDKFFSS